MSRTIRRFFTVALLGAAFPILLLGCATQYGGLGVTGGLESKMIGNAEAVVVVIGNGFTSKERVQDMLLLKSSELTSEAGYQRFSLLSIEDEGAAAAVKVSQAKLAEYVREKANSSGNLGPQVRTERTTIFYNNVPGAQIDKSGGGFFIVMYKAGAGGAYDAKSLIAMLKPKLVPPAETSASDKSKP